MKANKLMYCPYCGKEFELELTEQDLKNPVEVRTKRKLRIIK